MNYSARELLSLNNPNHEIYLFDIRTLLEIMRQNREERKIIDAEIEKLSLRNPKEKI